VRDHEALVRVQVDAPRERPAGTTDDEVVNETMPATVTTNPEGVVSAVRNAITSPVEADD
jgi:hypothetical protein